MKNLKKVLALVLVFASLFGLAAMASATTSDDYSDAASISHLEAVDVMSTIGVFDGISGAFSGSSILTREQAAKIITYMVLGKNDADALVASVAPYTDVARDRWSAGSIAYCKNAGILAGVGNGRFEPNGKLTGVAFAKMCLVALGYDPDVENLTGSEWAVNTSKLAIAGAKITGSLSQSSLADEMSREDACQMAFNTLKATMVDYDTRGTNITINGATISTGSSKAKPVASETNYADTKNDTGIANDEIQQFAEKYYPKLSVDLESDCHGRPANVWTYKSEEIGTYIRNDWMLKSWTAKASKSEMYNTIGSSVYSRLKNNTYKLRSYVDGGYVTANDTAAVSEIGWYFEKGSSKAAAAVHQSDDLFPGYNLESGNGVKTELYLNDATGDVYVVMINTYLVQATADYNTTKGTVSVQPIAFDATADETDENGPTGYKEVGTAFLPTEISGDDFDVAGVKEDDYLLITVSDIESNKSTVREVTPATVQKGTVTEYTDTTDVVMGDTRYTYNKILKDSKKDTKFAINSEATLVLDSYGYIMCVDKSVDANSYVYIHQRGTSGAGTKVFADAYFTDGTNDEIAVSKLDDSTKVNDIFWGLTPGWYTYSGTAGGQYTLESLDTDDYEQDNAYYTSNGDKLIKSGAIKFMGELTPGFTATNSGTDLTQFKGNDKTVFVIKEADGVSAYTGVSNVPNVTLGSGSTDQFRVYWAKKNSDGFVKYVFVDVSDDEGAIVDGGTSTADYMFVLKTTGNTTHADGLTYKKYTVVIDGKVEDRWVSTTLSVRNGSLYHGVREDSNGRIRTAQEVGKKGNNNRMFMAAMGEDGTGKYFASKTSDGVPANGGYDTELDTVITRSGNTLTIPALANAYNIKGDGAQYDKSDLIINDKSSINLVIGKGCDLLKDDDNSYETYLNTPVSQVTGLLGKKALCGRVYLVTTEDGGDVIDTLWIYVADVYDP